MENKIKVEELFDVEFGPDTAIRFLNMACDCNDEDDNLSARVDRVFSNEEKVEIIMELLASNRHYKKYYVLKKD